MKQNNKVKVRFAPSPTGYLHIGGLRSALYNYLFAKKNEGFMVLRIEDTDQKRFVEGAAENLVKSLTWAGLEWDEGVYLEGSKLTEEGENGPYFQSKRLELYKEYADQLVEKGKAYYCFCEPERLEKMRENQLREKQAPMYDKHCLKNITQEEINENLKKNCPFTIRLKVPKNEIVAFDDIVRNTVSYKTETIDDQVLMKSDGFPTYHLASVVDDHLMGITHIIRGEEWLPSTPKHVLLYNAFDWEKPIFAHLPLLLSKERKKLSKRDGDVAVEEYIEKGYLPEALMNFVAFLGWHPGKGETQEIYSLEELTEKFNLKNVHKGGAVFDIDKLDWINSQYIKKMSTDDLYKASLPFLKEKEFFKKSPENRKSEEFIKRFLEIEKERLTKLSEIGKDKHFFFNDIEYDKNLLKWKDMSDEDLKISLGASRNCIEKVSSEKFNSQDNILSGTLDEYLMQTASEQDMKNGEIFWPLRVALTGEERSPSPSEVVWVLGKDESLQRIDKALSMI